MGTSASRMILNSWPDAMASSVAVTPPSTEFSMGTMAASADPSPSRATSALSAVVAGIEGVGAVTQHEIKSEVDKQATETDRKEIKKLKAREDL
jgi:hypothetical protein